MHHRSRLSSQLGFVVCSPSHSPTIIIIVIALFLSFARVEKAIFNVGIVDAEQGYNVESVGRFGFDLGLVAGAIEMDVAPAVGVVAAVAFVAALHGRREVLISPFSFGRRHNSACGSNSGENIESTAMEQNLLDGSFLRDDRICVGGR